MSTIPALACAVHNGRVFLEMSASEAHMIHEFLMGKARWERMPDEVTCLIWAFNRQTFAIQRLQAVSSSDASASDSPPV